MKSKEIKLIDYQLISAILFIISILISILLTYNEKLEKCNKKTLLNEQISKYLNLFNRIFSLIIILFILYINYETYKIKRSNLNLYLNQIYASILSTIAAIIVLYTTIENFNKQNINTENPFI